MKKGEFVKLLKNPSLLDENTMGQLQEIVNEYPFFQAGRMLLLKNMHNIDHIRYNSELKQTAIYVSDRSRLFCLIHNMGFSNGINDNGADGISNNPVMNDDPELSTPQENKAQDKGDINDFEGGDQGNDITTGDDNRGSVTDNYLNASDDFLGDDSDLYSISRSFRKKKSRKNGIIEDIILPSADLLDYEAVGAYNIAELGEKETVDPNENRSFSDWLHIMRYSSVDFNKEEETHSKSMDLINSFLNERPKIVPKINKDNENVDLSEPSGSSDDDILSETLAEIYIKQGYKMKAISILEKLRLKYPEKNAYFAGRISDLEKN